MDLTPITLAPVIFIILSISSAYSVTDRIDEGLDKDFILGGMFPVHAKGPNDECGVILPEKGVQRLEAMLFAMDQINKNFGRWNLKLGFSIVDTCSSYSHALEQSLHFLNVGCSGNKSLSSQRVVGVVGAANSPVSESVASIFRLFRIPQVSYSSTSEELDDMKKYPYFFRVVPSDKYQIQVILDLLIRFGWTFVSAVAAKGEYGEKAIRKLQEIANHDSMFEEICFATTEYLERDAKDEDYDAVIDRFLKHEKARAVIVFLNEDMTKQLLARCKKKKVKTHRFLWLGSDGWGIKQNPVQGQEEAAVGAITILPKRFPIKAGFDEHFLSLKPRNNDRNPWFREYWQNYFHCTFDLAEPIKEGGRKLCTGNEKYSSSGKPYKQEGLVPMVIDAVHVLASALKSLCNENGWLCRQWEFQTGGRLLREYIRNVTFNSSQGNSMVINFDSSKSVQVNYTIYQYRKFSMGKDKYKYVRIGKWNPYSRLELIEKPVWGANDETGGMRKSLSSCSDTCHSDQERVKNLLIHPQCCWTCRECSEGAYLPTTNGPCEPCPPGRSPTPNRTTCEEMVPVYMGQHWSTPWTYVPIMFSIFGLLATTAVSVVFFMYQKTPVIMASGRELCYVILTGIGCCYCFTFIVMCKPSEIRCGLVRVSMGLGLSICYAAIFTKTNRISRIFNRSLRSVKRPAYISPSSQLAICLCLVLIQIVLTVMWLIIEPPSIRYETVERTYAVVCGIDKMSLILGLLYNMILIALCTVYAFKTRNMPENFNESKFISFTMYSSCIVWLAFIAIYSSTAQDFKVQATILCMSVSISGTVTLGCLFLPKIYIVLLKPEKNVRYPSSGNDTGSASCATSKPVRFLRPVNNATVTLSPAPGAMTLPNNIGDNMVIANNRACDLKSQVWDG